MFNELKSFQKSKLTRVPVSVRYPDGRSVIETRNDIGEINTQIVDTKGPGFVIDTKPDLQVAKVMEGLYLGSQDVSQDPDLLSSHTITTILNCSAEPSSNKLEAIAYVDIKILDHPETDITSYFDQCFSIIDSVLSANGSILVHCNAGVSRSATIVIAYLMYKLRLTLADATRRVKEVRPAIRPNDGFLNQLRQYENKQQK